MNRGRNNQVWKRLLSLALCLIMLQTLVSSALKVNAASSDIMQATSVALPEIIEDDTSTKVTIKEDVDNEGKEIYWWGIASQATAKIRGSINGIDNRSSVILDSPIVEGYGTSQTSSYIVVNTNWARFDMGKQDLMFYLELPVTGTGSSSIRMSHICADSWKKYPAPLGMTFHYLEADGATWVDSVVAANNQIDLPDGFKGFIRLEVNTAKNCADYVNSKIQIQEFGFRIGTYGGAYGPAKLGGAWFVSKGEAYLVSVDGEKAHALTTADPQPQQKDALTATMPAQEGAEIGAASSLIAIDKDPQWGGIASQATMKAAAGITPIGDQKSVVIDSPISEGYFNESGKTYPNFALSCGWGSLNTATQDIMFYIELPAAGSEIRMGGITCNSWSFWAAPSGMQYQYLAMDSDEWVDGTISTEGNKTLALPQGFKGYVRLRVNTAENAAQFPDTTLTVQNFTFTCDRFGGSNGVLKISGTWFVSKEDYTYIRVGDNAPVPMTVPVMEATTVSREPDYCTDTKVSYIEDSWKTVDSQAVITLGDPITKISDRESVVIDSVIPEGYGNGGTATWPLFRVTTNTTIDAVNQDIMFYVELPATMESLRIQDITCKGWSFWLGPAGMTYKYLSMDSNEWVSGTISADGNKQLALPQGFKGYIRLQLNTASNFAELGDAASALYVDAFHFRAQRFGADIGAIKIGGVWFVSHTDTVMVSVDGAAAVKMTYPAVMDVSLTLNKGVTVDVTINITEEWLAKHEGAQVVFSNGTKIAAEAGRKVYSTDLTPARINDELTVEIADGLNATDVSVKAYREKALSAGYEEGDTLIKLIDAALAYSNYADGVGENLKNDFTGVDGASVTHANKDAKLFAGFSGKLGAYASVYIMVNTQNLVENDTLVITIGGKEIYNGDMAAKVVDGYIVIDEIYPANFDAVISIQAGTEGSSATFTFNSYLKAVYSASTTSQYYKNLAVATYQYGLAAESYVNP